MPSDQLPSKREAFLTFFKDGWVYVHLDARRSDVQVPDHLKGEARLVLQYGANMPVPIDDLLVSEDGIRATLSFNRQPCETVIPWSSVYIVACTDGRGVLYHEDVPPEVLAEAMSAESADDAHDDAHEDAHEDAHDNEAAGGDDQAHTSDPADPKGRGGPKPVDDAAKDRADRLAAARRRVEAALGEAGLTASVESVKPRPRLKSIPMPAPDPAESDAEPAGSAPAGSPDGRFGRDQAVDPAVSGAPDNARGDDKPDGDPDGDGDDDGGRRRKPTLRLIK